MPPALQLPSLPRQRAHTHTYTHARPLHVLARLLLLYDRLHRPAIHLDKPDALHRHVHGRRRRSGGQRRRGRQRRCRRLERCCVARRAGREGRQDDDAGGDKLEGLDVGGAGVARAQQHHARLVRVQRPVHVELDALAEAQATPLGHKRMQLQAGRRDEHELAAGQLGEEQGADLCAPALATMHKDVAGGQLHQLQQRGAALDGQQPAVQRQPQPHHRRPLLQRVRPLELLGRAGHGGWRDVVGKDHVALDDEHRARAIVVAEVLQRVMLQVEPQVACNHMANHGHGRACCRTLRL